MFHFLKKRLISFFKIVKRWITCQSASNSDWSIELPFSLSEDTSNLLVDSLMNLQDVSFGELPSYQVVKKLKKEYIEVLNHIINIKVSDLINRMNNKVKRVPLNTIVKCAKVIFPLIEINGSRLLLWLINTMEFDPDEALYMENLLSSHIIVFTILNHYLTELNVGCFYRNLCSSSQITYKACLNDYDYAVYLCKKEIEENINGDLLNYKVKKNAKAKVDVKKWKFEFQPFNDKSSCTSNNTNDPEHITLQVLGQNNTMLQFRTKMNIRILKIMNAYCDKTDQQIEKLRFRYDGYTINQEDTPTTMKMKNNSVIEVYEDQIGA